MDLKKSVAAGLALAISLFAAQSFAAYQSDTDTGADKLDILENLRRHARENALTDEQKKLLADTKEMRQNLRRELNPSSPTPTIFEGDELSYDQLTGEFVAKGKVHILQMDAHQFDTDETTDEDSAVRGNTKTQEIEIPGKAHILQLTPDMPKVTLDGYRTYYNYGNKTGQMDEAHGKVDHQYVTGKRFEFYPDHVVIYNGTSTKCSAKVPDYHMGAEKITIWPNDKMILEKVKVYLKNKVIYSRDRMVQSLAPDAKGPEYPKVGYNSNEGVWISQDFSYPLAPNVNANLHLFAGTKHKLRPNGDVTWNTGKAQYIAHYGYFRDKDNNWIRKEPGFIFRFGDRLGKSQLNYGFQYEIGRWYNNGIRSNHTSYDFSLAHNPIVFNPHWYLFLSATYNITRETYNSSTVHGWNLNTTLLKYFDDKWAAYTGYYYASKNRENSLFAYNLQDYDRKLEAGFSYRLDDKNRFVVGVGYDMSKKRVRDIDYYWFHDIHCSQLILRYRAKRSQWQARWEFIPW